MSDRSVIQEKIVAVIRTVEPSLAEVPMPETVSFSALNLDSLRLIELGVLLEDAFGESVRFDDWLELERAKGSEAYSLGSLITFISKTGA
jgi:acyl carrier protein